MTVTYENTEDDLVAMSEAFYLHTPHGKKYYRFCMVMACLIIAIIVPLILISRKSSSGLGWIPALSISVVVPSLVYFLTMRYMQILMGWSTKLTVRGYRKMGIFDHVLCSQKVEVGEAGITQGWDAGELRFKWSSQQRLQEIQDAFLFFWNSKQFIRIPKHAFASEQEQSLFRTQVEQHLLMAKGTNPVAVPTAGSRHWWRDRQNVDSGTDAQKLGQGK